MICPTVVLHKLLLSQCHPHCRHMSSCLQKMFWHKPNLYHHQFPSCHALEHLGQPRTSKSWPEIIFEIILQIIQWQIKRQTFFFCNIPARFNLPFFHQLLFLQKEPQSDTKIPLFLRATVAWNSMFYHQLLLRWPKAWIDFLIFWKNNITKFYANDVNQITSLIFVVWEHLTYLTT